MNLKDYIRSIPDYPKKGILFRDITTLIKNSDAFNFAIDKILEISKKTEFNKPLIMMRKKNKLPADKHSVDFELEYGKATIEIHKDSLAKGDKVLIIDDLIATGGTAEAGGKLVEISKAKVAGFIFIINLFDLGGDKKLKDKSYFTESLIEFPGH